MSTRLKCPKAQRDRNRMLICRVNGQLCAHQRWCMMDGMAVLTNESARCPARDAEDGDARFAVKAETIVAAGPADTGEKAAAKTEPAKAAGTGTKTARKRKAGKADG